MTGAVAVQVQVQVQVQELEDGVWVATAAPLRADGSVDASVSPAGTEWRSTPRFVAASARVRDVLVWSPESDGLGSRAWLSTPARAALYALLGRATNSVEVHA